MSWAARDQLPQMSAIAGYISRLAGVLDFEAYRQAYGLAEVNL